MKAFEIFVNIFLMAVALIWTGLASLATYLMYIRVFGGDIINPIAMVVAVSLYVVLTKMTAEDYISNIKELLSE